MGGFVDLLHFLIWRNASGRGVLPYRVGAAEQYNAGFAVDANEGPTGQGAIAGFAVVAGDTMAGVGHGRSE